MKKKIKVVINSATRWTYFQWFILGFYQLEKEGKIVLKFDLSFKDWLRSNRYTNRIGEKFKLFRDDSYNLYGYVEYPDGEKKHFCIDSADSPFLFNVDDLKKVSCYFKMQYPIDIDKEDFSLARKVHIPWLDHAHKNENGDYFVARSRGERRECDIAKYRNKIKPLMIGPRRLGTSICYRDLKRGYENYISARNTKKEKKIMCYFGNAKGPTPMEKVEFPDFDSETNIMEYFDGKISHPNEKRSKIAEIISGLGENCDARIISQVFSYNNNDKNKNLEIPLKNFCKHISKFQYNFNVSGFRLSIPNRFIESFIVGTGIITDKLSVKWYLPFDKEEVIETVNMGYEKDEDIDWKQVKKDLKNLKDSNPEKVVTCFEKKWAPKVVSQYILDEIKNS